MAWSTPTEFIDADSEISIADLNKYFHDNMDVIDQQAASAKGSVLVASGANALTSVTGSTGWALTNSGSTVAFKPFWNKFVIPLHTSGTWRFPYYADSPEGEHGQWDWAPLNDTQDADQDACMIKRFDCSVCPYIASIYLEAFVKTTIAQDSVENGTSTAVRLISRDWPEDADDSDESHAWIADFYGYWTVVDNSAAYMPVSYGSESGNWYCIHSANFVSSIEAWTGYKDIGLQAIWGFRGSVTDMNVANAANYRNQANYDHGSLYLAGARLIVNTAIRKVYDGDSD